VIQTESYDPQVLTQRLKKLVQTEEIYRIKGFVHVPQKSMRLVLQGVGDRFDVFYDRLWKPDEVKQTKLVFIGKALNQETIEKAIAN
jgi:cobalamin biosynthesis protein CobW